MSVSQGQPERLLDVETVAELLGCHSSHVRRQMKAEKIPAVYLGRLLRFRQSDVEAYIAKLPRAASKAEAAA
jgi:excisionase family DNA binding protein